MLFLAPVRISTDANGAQAVGGVSYSARLSSDGVYAVFASDATNLVPGDTNGQRDVFLKNLQSGAIVRLSTDSIRRSGGRGSSFSPIFSPDGQFVLFGSTATNSSLAIPMVFRTCS
jgi:Tol biopolymer transport system component